MSFTLTPRFYIKWYHAGTTYDYSTTLVPVRQEEIAMNYPQIKTYTTKENVEKFKYIAEQHNRNSSKELEMLVKKHIAAYEQEHGVTTVPDPHELGGG